MDDTSPTIEQLIPPEQMRQLADILHECMRRGYGIVEIDIKDHHIREFRKVQRLPAKRPPDDWRYGGDW